MTTPDIADLCSLLRGDLPFHEDDGAVNECDVYARLTKAADTLERQAAENKRLREASDGLLAAMFECQDKLWVGRCDSRDDGFRAAAKRAVEMADAARDKYRAALTGEDT